MERNGFTYLDQPLKILCSGCRKKPKRHFQIALNLISVTCPASKNTYHRRIWGLNVPLKMEPQFYKGLGKGTLEVVPARFPGPWSQTDFWKWECSGYRGKYFSACSLGTCGNQQAELGVLGSLLDGILTKKRLKLNQNELGLLFWVPKWGEGF